MCAYHDVTQKIWFVVLGQDQWYWAIQFGCEKKYGDIKDKKKNDEAILIFDIRKEKKIHS